ncbi:MAG: SH3 domain-containing protein [Chloroflexota bacterium]|nr:SH3 domain-containing protein [Chloroflexota bacterium]
MFRFSRHFAQFCILTLVLLATSSPTFAQDTVIPTIAPGGALPTLAPGSGDGVIPTLAGRADTCPVLVEQALTRLDASCADLGRNQACYGNFRVEATPRATVSVFNFLQPGDVVSVNDLQTMRTRSLDVVSGEWGISVFRIQANLPDTLPGENVTMLIFGDVQLENAPEGSNGFGTMQSFFIETAFTGVECADAPRDGILLQTPPNVGPVELRINDVDISLASTVFIGYHEANAMRVFTLEGDVNVTAMGETVNVPPGARTGVRMSDDNRALTAPSAPAAFDAASELGALPLDELPELVTIPDGAVLPTAAAATGCIVTNPGTADGNVRARPALDAPIRGSLPAGSTANAIGRSADNQWVQIDIANGGWISRGIVTLSGNCDTLPITFALIAPTVPPQTLPPRVSLTPTLATSITPTFARPLAGDYEYPNVVIEYQDGAGASLYGELSFPDGNRQDTINYSTTAPASYYFPPGSSFEIYGTCSGQGTENTFVIFSDGTSVPCNSGGFQRSEPLPPSGTSASGTVTMTQIGGDGAFVTWQVQIYLVVPYTIN